jgi:hypothetical protein
VTRAFLAAFGGVIQEIHMTRSIILAGWLAASLAACAQPATPPIAREAATSFAPITGFAPYCGPVWSVAGQGYRDIPCPPGRSYHDGTGYR